MNGYRPRYTQEQWLQIKPGLYEAVFPDVKPIVRVKAVAWPVYYGGPGGGTGTIGTDFQMGELLG